MTNIHPLAYVPRKRSDKFSKHLEPTKLIKFGLHSKKYIMHRYTNSHFVNAQTISQIVRCLNKEVKYFKYILNFFIWKIKLN